MTKHSALLAAILIGVSILMVACQPSSQTAHYYATPQPCDLPIIVATAVPPGSSIQPTPIAYLAAEAYLAEVLHFIHTDSLHQDRFVDWWAFHDAVILAAADPQTNQDAYPAIQFALTQLCDNHSFFLEPGEAQQFLSEGILPGQSPLLVSNGRLLNVSNSALAYLELPTFWGEAEAAAQFASQTQAQIHQLDEANPCGWLLDLRRNNGGNLWGMLAGVAPLLPKGWVGSLVFADGRVRRWHVQDNEVLVDGRQFAKVSGAGYRLKNDEVPVAVLISSQTGSAGEGVLVAFLSRPDSRVFGEATVGLASANVARTFSDGAMLFLATAWFVDRNGQIYDGRILPDEEIAVNWDQFGTDEDDVLQTAVAWLQDQPGCAK